MFALSRSAAPAVVAAVVATAILAGTAAADEGMIKYRQSVMQAVGGHTGAVVGILKGEVPEMKSLIAKSREAGMQTFDQALFNLFEERKITYEDALRNADSVNDIRLRIKLESDTARKSGLVDDHREFELEESEDETASGMI